MGYRANLHDRTSKRRPAMIHWPEDAKLSKIAKENLALLRKSGPLGELEDSKSEWTLINWPWMPDPPHRFIFRSENFEVRTLTRTDGGLWTISEAP